MIRHTTFLLVLTLTIATCCSAADSKKTTASSDTSIKPGVRSPITFSTSPEVSDNAQLKMRMHAAETPPPFSIGMEKFDIIVPKKYKKGDPHGLFIWISPSNAPSLSPEWEAVLADKKLIFVGAHNSGNNREVFARMRMAVDANDNLRNLYDIDDQRVYVSGFSGGARVASMLGVTYAEMFTGTIAFMGVNFYTDIVTLDKTEVFEARYIPHDEILGLAKTDCRYVLVTGEKDFNLKNTSAVFENGFKKEGFKSVELMNIPAQGHQPPKAEWLIKALDYLDAGKATKK
ncbi:alpha/beta hydrolase family protein [Prosthecobacter sp.]|uniref:alpha/beta hydrolase family protein n=1 Tax=Prosthecobacter sp. TaxID=1965333 RepID=UPI003784D197